MKRRVKIDKNSSRWLMAAALVMSGGAIAPAYAYAAPMASQQQAAQTIQGTVVDESGEPIIGAAVLVKGAASGVNTDIEGNFSIKASIGQELEITSVGYTTVTVKVTGDHMTITMKEDSQLLNDVVVIGYGTQKKGDITSAVASVKAEDFTIGNFNDAGDLIKGKVAGLTITRPSGDPGAGTEISLRGIVSVSGNNSPLVLVDGVPGSLGTVPPENIASIDVLKDASAAAIYGTRGAAGVILITTKTGSREQKATATYAGYVSWSKWAKKADFMTAEDVRAGLTNFNDEGYDTDWLKAITQNAVTQNHSFSITGGSASTSYYGNITYRKADGIIKKTGNEGLSMSFDISHWMFNDMLKVNLNIVADSYKYLNSAAGADGEANIYRQAVIRNPTSPIYNEDGTYNEGVLMQYNNPVSLLEERSGESKSLNLRMTGNITFEPIKGWQTNLMLATDRGQSRGGDYYTSNHSSDGVGGKGSRTGYASIGDSDSQTNYIELTSKYRKTFDLKHRFEGLVGYSWSEEQYANSSMSNYNFPTDFFGWNNIGAGTALDKGNAGMYSYKESSKLIGWFGRVSYGYDERYNILASMRYEGSSKFGANHKWGAFPSVSLGWNIVNEQFMERMRDSWLTNLKLRAGYGITGVIPGGSYLSMVRYTFDGGNYYRNGQWNKGLKADSNANPDLKWEKANEFNVGLDWGVLNDRLGGSIDFYHKTTSDMLYDYAVPSPPNLYNSTTANVGKMRNTGIEVMINAIPVQTPDFSWKTTVTMQHNANKLVSLSNDLYQTDNIMWLQGVGDPVSQTTHKVVVGETFGQIWGLKAVGVSDNGLFLIENPRNGLAAEYFQEMRNDYEEWYQPLGNGIPKVTIGWNNTFFYKDFDLSMQFNGQFGHKIVNQQRVFYENNAHAYNRLKSAADIIGGNRALSSSQGQVVTSYHIENGDYLKLSNITLGYTYRPKDTRYIKDVRLYGSVYNVFCITKYKGMDPELGTYNFWTAGVDSRDKYPTVRQFTVGLNVTF